jgi:hypothetical protein
MKSLLTLNLAAMAPSPSIAVKKTLSLLRAIGLSAGLVASTASMPAVHAATSATIRATGTVPNTCSVSGANIAMVKVNNTNGESPYLQGSAENVPYSTGEATIISIARPTLSGPAGYTGDGAVYALVNNEIVAIGTVNGYLQNFNVPLASSGRFTYHATVNSGAYVDGSELLPGNYELSTTITCVAN